MPVVPAIIPPVPGGKVYKKGLQDRPQPAAGRRPRSRRLTAGPGAAAVNYLRARTRGISLSMSEDCEGLGELTFSKSVLIM